MEDFEQGFFQNLIGNSLSFYDITEKMKESIVDEDYITTVYQIGRLFRRLFDFTPMKSASGPAYTLKAANQSILDSLDLSYNKVDQTPQENAKRNSAINELEIPDINTYVDAVINLGGDEDENTPQVGEVYIGPLQNRTNWFSMPFYLVLGFVDGAFGPSNITDCRINSLRLVYNISRLAFHADVGYGVDMIMKYTSQSLKQFYPFSFHCYYTGTESYDFIYSGEM